MTLTITPTIARRLAVTRQRLGGQRPSSDRDGILDLLRDIRCLQLDPIRAVERSHLLVLWSRLGNYDPADLDALLWDERALFEYWAHAASIVLTEDYPLFRAKMRRWGKGQSAGSQRVRQWLADNEPFQQYVLDELARRGPLASDELEDRSQVDWPSSGWTNNRNVGQMLDFLWSQGLLMVAGRRGIKRLWGLADDCLPDWTPQDDLTPRQVTRRAAQHALRALGVATPKQITNHFTRGGYSHLKKTLGELVAEGHVIAVEVAENGRAWPGPWYIHADVQPDLARLEGDWQPRTTLLSPFDNLICDRDRTELLWDYRFRTEIYTPKAKRQYGYYVLSILHGDRFVGRMDPRLDRKAKRLLIHAVHAEPDAPLTADVGAAIATAVADLARFLDAGEVVYTGSVPDGWREGLQPGS